MHDQTQLRVVDIVGSGLCLFSTDGQKVHDAIVAELREGRRVCLSFKGTEALTAAFLNVGVGQLYGEFPGAQIRAKLSVADASQNDLVLLKRVVDRAKEFFADPRQLQTVVKDLQGDDDEP